MATYQPSGAEIFPQSTAFTPDFAFLDTMLRRKQMQYEQGFAKVAGKYNFLTRQMTQASNQQFRDTFLKQASDSLKNLSAMDLSDPSNVRAASSVFTPFYENQLALKDMALTEQLNRQTSFGESDMQRGDANSYNPASLKYLQMVRNAFANDTPESVNYYLGLNPKYVPYADYTKKVNEAIEKLKPYKMSGETPVYGSVNGVSSSAMYMRGQDLEWLSADRVREYLDNTLTAAEKEQIRLEGIVKYGFNDAAIKQDYMAYTQRNIAAIDGEIEKLKSQYKIVADPKVRSSIDDRIKAYSDRKANLLKDSESVNTQSPDAFKRMRDNIASQLHYNEVISDLSNAAAYRQEKNTLKVNDAWSKIYEQSQINARAAAEREEKAKKDKEDVVGVVTLPVAGGQKMSESALNEQITGYDKKINDASLYIAQHLRTYNGRPNDPKSVKEFISRWDEESKKLVPITDANGRLTGRIKNKETGEELSPQELGDYKAYTKWASDVQTLKFEQSSLIQNKNNIIEKVNNLPEVKKNLDVIEANLKKVNGGKKVQIAPGVSLTAFELYKALVSGEAKYNINTTSSVSKHTVGNIDYSLTYKGKTYPFGTTTGMSTTITNPNIEKILNPVLEQKRSEYGKNYQKEREAAFANTQAQNEEFQILLKDSDREKRLRSLVEGRVGAGEVGSFLISPTTGRISFTLKADSKLKPEDVQTSMNGFEGFEQDLENKRFYFTSQATFPGEISNLSGFEKSVLNLANSPLPGKKDPETNSFELQSGNFKLGGLPYNFYFKRLTDLAPGNDQGVASAEPSFYIYVQGSDNPISPMPGGIQLNSPLQLIQELRNFNANPEYTIKLVENAINN